VPPLHQVGDEVLVVGGPFVERIATIAETNEETAIVTLAVFDRIVRLEVPYGQLAPPPQAAR
jgi:transcription antitermination factor NusG